jgi:hypothetical protein
MKSIEQRMQTIKRVVEAIVEYQMDFFEKGKELKPLSLHQIAEVAEIHESTVSRAIKGKYAQTPRGLFEIKKFFARGMQNASGEEISTLKIKTRINILDDKINTIGDDEFALSSSWYTKEKNKLLITQLKNNTYNYFSHKINGKSKDNMWTTFKKQKANLSGKGYQRGFVSLTARATNDYADKYNLAYLSNIFFNPLVKQFFVDRNVKVNEDLYALSEMIQWIWRSRIRKDNDEIINLYIPSSRMRRLLNNWLGK